MNIKNINSAAELSKNFENRYDGTTGTIVFISKCLSTIPHVGSYWYAYEIIFKDEPSINALSNCC